MTAIPRAWVRFVRLSLLASVASGLLEAQTGGFIATLGRDTVQVESFSRSARSLSGTVVTRSPVTLITHWQMALDSLGSPMRYEARVTRGDGSPIRGIRRAGALSYTGTSTLRETPTADRPDSLMISSTVRIWPGPSVPFLGVSYLIYEEAIADARRRATADGASAFRSISMVPEQRGAGQTRVWFVADDSVEIDYFGVARSGWRLGPDGRLLAADWSRTTFRYRIQRTAELDVATIAAGWHAADRAGSPMGVLSPRDTVRGSFGAVEVLVDYSRPAMRGRAIWGELVPFGKVWRLGADVATHVTFNGDVVIGGAAVPAGTYTLWMLPTGPETAELIVNRRVMVFGTNYSASDDLVRVPLEHRAISEPVDRVTIEISGDRLSIKWDRSAWSVAVRPRTPDDIIRTPAEAPPAARQRFR